VPQSCHALANLFDLVIFKMVENLAGCIRANEKKKYGGFVASVHLKPLEWLKFLASELSLTPNFASIFNSNMKYDASTEQERQESIPLFLAGKSNAIGVVADKAIPHAKGILTESGVGPFHLALKKILVNHAGTTDSLGTPYIKDIHTSTCSSL
jgi:hypothetical protein